MSEKDLGWAVKKQSKRHFLSFLWQEFDKITRDKKYAQRVIQWGQKKKKIEKSYKLKVRRRFQIQIFPLTKKDV